MSTLRSTAMVLLSFTHLASAFSLQSLRNALSPQRDERALWRRQSENNTIPAALNIGPSQYWDGIDGPWSSFPISVGSGSTQGEQQVRVFPSTAATAVWTISAEGCPSFYGEINGLACSDSRGFLFNPNISLTWASNSIYQTGVEENLGMDTAGPVGYDVVTLGWPGSVEVTYNHSPVWNLADSQYWLGVFGLLPAATNFTTMNAGDPSFIETIFDNGEIPSKAYAYTAGAQYRLNQIYGSLTLGGYDSNRFIANNITFPFYTDIERDLTVYLQSISATNTNPSNLLPDGSISIFIDSTVPELWLPESACSAFEDAFGLEYDDNFQRYLLTSSQRDDLLSNDAEVTFTIGPEESGGETVDITFPYAAFDKEVHYPIVVSPNTSYYFPLRRAANSTQYTLGRTFLQEAYLIADYERGNFSVSQCDWDQSRISTPSIANIVSPTKYSTSSDSDSGFSAGAIAGVVVGVVAVIAAVALVFWILRRRKRGEKQRLAELEAREAQGAGKHDPNASDADNEGKPFISQPMGGELAGEERFELNAPQKVHAQEMDSPYKMDPNKAGYSEMEGADYYGPGGKGYAMQEMDGRGTGRPVFEMPGSEVSEMPVPERRSDK